MRGLMQGDHLLISSLIEFANKNHGDSEIISRRVEGDIHRSNWATIYKRSKQVARALDRLQIAAGERVATLAWNGYRHLELYYGVSGSERVLHTLNPRLLPDQIAWIIDHAQDQVVCFETTFVPIIKAIHANCPHVKYWIALCDEAALPLDPGLPTVISYESWIKAEEGGSYTWPQFDENTASSMCYTSGTTGHPKAALYSHRSTLLHAFSTCQVDAPEPTYPYAITFAPELSEAKKENIWLISVLLEYGNVNVADVELLVPVIVKETNTVLPIFLV